MKDVLEEYGDFMKILMKERLPTLFAVNLHNQIILNTEILDSYYSKWSKNYSLPAHEIKEIKEKNGERIISINKKCFVEMMSTFEYDMKLYLQNATNEKLKEIQSKLKNGKFLMLSEIIKTYKKSGLISEEDYKLILGITKIRNMIVHNDARPTDLDIEPSLLELFNRYEVDQQLNANYNVFLKLQIMLYEFYKKWYISQKNIYEKFVPKQPSVINYKIFK